MTPHVHGRLHKTCPELECAAARARYTKRWKVDNTRGIPRTVPADTVRLHVFSLLGAGWSARGIAGAAGVAPQTITGLKRGARKAIRRPTAARILAIRPGQELARDPSHGTSEPFVSRVGTVRRIRALMFMGYSHRDLTGYGISPANLTNQAGQWITRSNHDKVAALYRELSHKPGPTPRSHREAVRRGYVGPMAWHDIDHDLAPETDDLAYYLRECGTEPGYNRHRSESTPICDDCREAHNRWYTQVYKPSREEGAA